MAGAINSIIVGVHAKSPPLEVIRVQLERQMRKCANTRVYLAMNGASEANFLKAKKWSNECLKVQCFDFATSGKQATYAEAHMCVSNDSDSAIFLDSDIRFESEETLYLMQLALRDANVGVCVPAGYHYMVCEEEDDDVYCRHEGCLSALANEIINAESVSRLIGAVENLDTHLICEVYRGRNIYDSRCRKIKVRGSCYGVSCERAPVRPHDLHSDDLFYQWWARENHLEIRHVDGLCYDLVSFCGREMALREWRYARGAIQFVRRYTDFCDPSRIANEYLSRSRRLLGKNPGYSVFAAFRGKCCTFASELDFKSLEASLWRF